MAKEKKTLLESVNRYAKMIEKAKELKKASPSPAAKPRE